MIAQEVRENVGEESESHWTDLGILRKMNFAYKQLWMQLAMQAGDWLLYEGTITLTDSEGSLPSDCAKPVYMEDSNGYVIPINLTVREKKRSEFVNTAFEESTKIAYLVGNTLVVNQTGLSGTYTLWYVKRFVELAWGTCGANCAASALHLDSTMNPSITNDYYNGVGVVVYDATAGVNLDTTITDYVGSTLIATITGTPVQNDYYGTKIELPEEALPVLVWRVTLSCMAKPSAALDPKYYEFAANQLAQADRLWREWISDRVPGSGAVRITERSYG